jgi:hypothetical protein
VTSTSTITSTRTVTGTPTSTRTPTITPTATATFTETATRTSTRTRTATNTRVPTFTPTVPPTKTVTRTRTPTIDLPVGPLITHFGLAKADGRVEDPADFTQDGIPIFERQVGSGFLILVEGRRGKSNRSVGTNLTNSNPDDPGARPDLQIEARRNLGDGSTLVCDRGPVPDAPIGGVPAVNPPSFEVTQAISDALNDFACRFDFHITTADACTKDDLGNFAFVSPQTQTQFCSVPAVGVELLFPSGDTEVTVRLRDQGGNIGNERKIIVRAP